MQSTAPVFPIFILVAVAAFCVGIVIVARVANVRARTRGLVTPQRVAAMMFLTIVHVVMFAWAWGSAFAMGDAGLRAPASLDRLIEILGFPLMHFRWAYEGLLILIIPIVNGAIWAIALIAILISMHRLMRRGLIRKNEDA
jgi:hypothetical protein